MAKILVVDDEKDVRDLLTDILLDAGHDVIEAVDGGEAVDKARNERPDLMMLDVLMPVMDGLQVLRRLREDPATEEMPVVLVTAFSVEDDDSPTGTFRYTHYITKPWRRGAVELAVKNALREAETVKRTQLQIVQQERLSALGQLASGIAHDFNNALMPILVFSELLLNQPEKLDDQDTSRGRIEMTHTAALDASGVVARLRDFYRTRERGDVFTLTNVNDLVGQSLSLTQSIWRDEAQAKGIGIEVATDLSASLPAPLGFVKIFHRYRTDCGPVTATLNLGGCPPVSIPLLR